MVHISSEQFYGEGYEDCDRRVPNLDKATELLGWAPEWSLEGTLRETITYYYDLYGKDSRSQSST
jgi:UDP-apiose/xylose synthase